MNLLQFIMFPPSEQDCYEFLENIIWKGEPQCPRCQSKHVNKRNEKKIIGRWNCYACKTSFRATYNTLFHDTKMPLQKWFHAILLIYGVEKCPTSVQLARQLKINQKTAWYMIRRILNAVEQKDNRILKSIVEAEDTDIGQRKD